MRPLRRGPHVHIRPLAGADEGEFIERARASRSLHRPWSYPPLTPAGFREMLEPRDGARSERLLVCRNEDGALAGSFGLGQLQLGLALRYLKSGGRWRDHEQWAITTEDRRARPSA